MPDRLPPLRALQTPPADRMPFMPPTIAQEFQAATRKVILSPQAGLAAATLLWSGNFVVGRGLRDAIDPLELNFWRWSIALVVLLPFTAAGLARQWRSMRQHVGLVSALGLTGIALPHTCIYAALQTTSAVNALLLLNLTPLLVALGTRILFGEPIYRWQWIGMSISLAGAVLLLVQGSAEALLALAPTRGDLWMLPAVAGAAAHVLLLRQTPAGATQGPLLAASIAAALAMMLPLLLWRGELAVPAGVRLLAGLAYIGVPASALAFLLWNRGVARIGPPRAAPFMYLMPVYGSLLSLLVLGEPVQGFQYAGGALVLLGLWLARPPRRSGA
jgi:drug/metabolite transporter (DMT)-like permease